MATKSLSFPRWRAVQPLTARRVIVNGYPNGDLLVDADWLEQHLTDPDLRILDVRASDPRLPIGYRMGHIPGAISLDATSDFFIMTNGSSRLKPADEIARVLGEHGISNDARLVIYDEWTGQLAGLAYWVLRYVGHRQVAVLHGGWAAWQQRSGPITREKPFLTPVKYRPEPNDQARASAEWIQMHSEQSDVLVLDARTRDEYEMGHIPGSANLPYESALAAGSQTYKDADAVRAELEAVGATPDKEIVTYCVAGARSAHMFLTLQLLGYPRVRNYDGSIVDWYYKRGLPIER